MGEGHCEGGGGRAGEGGGGSCERECVCLLVTVKLRDGVRVSMTDGITMAVPTLTAPHTTKRKNVPPPQRKTSFRKSSNTFGWEYSNRHSNK